MLSLSQLVALARSLRNERVLSVYVHGAAEDPAARLVWRRELDKSLRDLRRWLLGSSHEEREVFERSVERLGELLTPYAAGMPSQGWVAFITEDMVHDSELLPVPMPTMAIWSTGMCVAPYVHALKLTRPVIIAVVDARAARIHRYQAGKLAALETIHAHATIDAPEHMGDVPRMGFHSGVRGETAHDAVQRAHAVGTERMLRQAEAAVVRHAGQSGWVLIGGIHGVGARMAEAIATALPGRVRHLESLAVHATEAEIAAAARAGASTLRAEWDLKRIEDILDTSELGRATVGAAATRVALDRAQVRELYLTARYIEEYTADAEEEVRSALDQGAMVEVVSSEAAMKLEEHGGVASRLRYRVANGESETPAMVTPTMAAEGVAVLSANVGPIR